MRFNKIASIFVFKLITMRLTLFIFFASFYFIGKAQNKFVLCSEYTNDGTYTGANDSWSLKKGGNFVYFFYQSETLINDSIFVRIDKSYNRKDTNFYHYDHYHLLPGASKKWAANKYTFLKTGKYKITLYDKNSKQLTESVYANIYLDEKEYDDMYFLDTWYYSQSKITFFDKVVRDSLYDQKNVFAYDSSGTKIIVYVGQQNKKPLRTDHLFVSVYTADKCHELISSHSYYTNDKWHWTHLPVYMRQKGKFIVEIYNDDDVFINSAVFEVK